MHSTMTVILLGFFCLAFTSISSAQLTSAKDGPVVYGHHHLNVTSIETQKQFWVNTLGGEPAVLGNSEIVKFPNVLVFMREQTPTDGTIGSTVNHIGFWVPSVRAMIDTIKAAGYPIITRAELPASQEVVDDLAYIADQDTYIAYAMAPDNIKVEFVENRTQTIPLTLHHIHFYSHQLDAMKAWYVQTFEAIPGMRGSFEAADLPGVNLTFSPSSTPSEGTKGRSLDHIGFEVDDLKNFCQRLESQGVKFDRPYREIPGLGIGVAFLTDPFGTYIELTEGLDKL